MVERDELELICASQKGDLGAFEELIRRHQRMIHSLTFRMTGSLADAEDVAQETFVQAYRQLDAFRGDARFASWLYRIAANTAINWKRRDQRRTEVLRAFGAEADSAGGPVDVALAQRVQEALMKLNPKQRAAVVLTTYDGLSHAEAARALGCSETTISWRVFAARAKLKRWLKDLVTP